ncbi:hypothetical protein [Sphingomonas sp. ID0503]|uniref:hypothetical protein n=1 Tax=Sphingomonas sp. ID0503 TaxID=3399691 RepID=UPI003AFAE32A
MATLPQDGQERGFTLRHDVERLCADFAGLPVRILYNRLREVRMIAAELGWTPLVALVRRCEEAVADGSHVVARGLLTDAMRDAAALGKGDAAASQAYLASVNMRLRG